MYTSGAINPSRIGAKKDDKAAKPRAIPKSIIYKKREQKNIKRYMNDKNILFSSKEIGLYCRGLVGS